jgi:twitching motility protein PilJ
MADSRTTARGTVLTYLVGFLALVCIAAAAVDFFFVAQYSVYDTEFLNQASTVAVQSQALPNEARAALNGDRQAFGDLANSAQRMSGALSIMGSGDSRTLMPAASGAVASSLSLLQQQWGAANRSVQIIAKARTSVLVSVQAASAVRQALPVYVNTWNQLAQRMAAHGLSRELINRASAQALIAAQIGHEMDLMMSGLGGFTGAANAFVSKVNSSGDVLNAFSNGSSEMNITALPNYSDIQAALGKLQTQYQALNSNLQTLAPVAAPIVDWQKARAALNAAAPQMLSTAQDIMTGYQAQMKARPFKPLYGYILGGLALLFIIALVFRYQMTGEARRAARVQQEMNERNQQSIMRLMDDLATLADGDLTMQLEVTEDITGAISDSINYTVEALRDLVKTINDTAVQVDSAARQTEATASHLAEAAENQNTQITTATASIAQMAQSVEQVSTNAERAAEVASSSVKIAHKGGEAVRRTIDGMASIRETIQETSKRMKRLGESSQEVGDIVELINDIAEQTNILALNAAIQASTAGEAGRGFGVVADEVQRLAERAAGATRQIETLVRTIQSDTHEAILSMEQSTTGVVNGARLAEDAGHALDEIEAVSNNIARLIQMISGAAREQAQVAGEVSSTMSVIQEITSQTAEGTAVTARSIGKLAALSADLRRSVSGFTLPQENDEFVDTESATEMSNLEEDTDSEETPLVTAGDSA